jgi:serine/threonine protein kinase
MATADWEKAKLLFYRALELEPARRAAFLDAACDADAALRREVDALLDADAEASQFLARVPAQQLGAVAQALAGGGDLRGAPSATLQAVKVCTRCHAALALDKTVCPHDGGALTEEVAALVGTVLDGTYRIEALLGCGGMGAVYRARHAVLGDLVALKLLPPHVSADPVWRQRFVREGQAARAVRHPNLVLVHDLRTSGEGVPYLVMEYVAGRTLREELAQVGRCGPAEALGVLEAVAGALDAAHAAGVVHRDLKPENIMVGGEGGARQIKVLDLGIAKLRELAGAEGSGPLTLPGQVLGTPAYMAPEQWGAVPRDGGLELDGRADVYSLGVVAYELLSGRVPFAGRSAEEFRRAHLQAAAAPEGTKPGGWAVLGRALAKDRAERPASAGQFVAELRAAFGWSTAENPYVTQPIRGGNTAAGARPNVFPELLTRLIGREREVRELTAELRREEVRLLTLTGAAGVGKTRLALEVAGALREEGVGSVYVVELAAVPEAELVLPAIAQGLGVREEAATRLLESLTHVLSDKQVLVVLDNFEQVLDAAPLVAELLAGLPGLKMLVTSRERLRVRAEREYLVLPLAVPSAGRLSSAEDAAKYAAVTLFAERARVAMRGFVLTEENVPAVAEICRRLDGLPLAIELAAARVKLLSPQALLSRLTDRLKLLTGGERDRLELRSSR